MTTRTPLALLLLTMAPGCVDGSTPGGGAESETGGEIETTDSTRPTTSAGGSASAATTESGDPSDTAETSAPTSGTSATSGTTGDTGDTDPGTTTATGETTSDGGCDEATFACSECDAVVPDDFETITEAVISVAPQGQVCVRAGTYPEDVVMQPHVSITGVGPQTRIEGVLRLHEMPDDDPTVTRVTDLSVHAPQYHAVSGCEDADVECLFDYEGWLQYEGQTLALDFDRVELQGDTGRHCFILLVTGDVEIGFRDSVCRGGQGVRLRQFTDPQQPKTTALRVIRSQFEPAEEGPTAYIASPVFLSSSTPSGDVLTASPAMAVQLEVTDSMFVKLFGEISIVYGAFWLGPTNSYATISHNTMSLRSNSGPEEGPVQLIDRSEVIPMTYANNLVQGFLSHLGSSFMQPTVSTGNLVGPSSWFVDPDGGDLRLVPGATAVDAADNAHATASDVFGVPRPLDGDGDGTAFADVGAHELSADRPVGGPSAG